MFGTRFGGLFCGLVLPLDVIISAGESCNGDQGEIFPIRRKYCGEGNKEGV